jgi:hypothetical protein
MIIAEVIYADLDNDLRIGVSGATLEGWVNLCNEASFFFCNGLNGIAGIAEGREIFRAITAMDEALLTTEPTWPRFESFLFDGPTVESLRYDLFSDD